jgi:hypothetical protein
MVTVAVACRRTSSARATDMHQFLRCDAFSSQLFDVLPVKSNTFITDRDIAWSCDESVDLVLTFPAEGTPREGAPLWLVVHPHRSSGFLSCLIDLLLECSPEIGSNAILMIRSELQLKRICGGFDHCWSFSQSTSHTTLSSCCWKIESCVHPDVDRPSIIWRGATLLLSSFSRAKPVSPF